MSAVLPGAGLVGQIYHLTSPIGLDIETTGLDLTRDRITVVALADPHQTLVIPVNATTREPLALALRDLFARTPEVILHNAYFDLPRLMKAFNLPVPSTLWDTMVTEAMLVAGQFADTDDRVVGISLKETVRRHLGEELDKSAQTSFQGGDLTADQVAYAARDASVLLELRERQAEQLRVKGMVAVHQIERDALPAFTRMGRYGLPVNRVKLEALVASWEAQLESYRQRVVERFGEVSMEYRQAELNQAWDRLRGWEVERQEYERDLRACWPQLVNPRPEWTNPNRGAGGHTVGENQFVRDMLRSWGRDHPKPPVPDDHLPEFNPQSPGQLKRAFAALGYTLETTRAEALQLHAFSPVHRRDYVTPLLQYRLYQKRQSTFGGPLLEALRPMPEWGPEMGVIYSTIFQCGTGSGRPTSMDPNLLQLPRDEAMRGVVVAPQGYRIIVADYSQMELRIMAELSQDPAMLRIFQSGEDIHWNTAKLLFGHDPNDAERHAAKTINFLILYGGGPRRLMASAALGKHPLYLSLNEAQDILNEWQKAFTPAWQTIEGWRQSARTSWQARSPWGRERTWPAGTPEYRVMKAAANHVIQSANADITKLAMAVVDRLIAPLGAWIALQIYDELLVVAPEAVAGETARIVEAAMSGAAEQLLKTVPAVVKAVVGDSWAEKA